MLKTDAFSGMMCPRLVATVHPFCRPQVSRVLCDVRGSAVGTRAWSPDATVTHPWPMDPFRICRETGKLGIWESGFRDS